LTGFQYNSLADDGLIISSGNQTSHIIPIIGGKAEFKMIKRIPIGGFNHTELLSKSLFLKYPQHRLSID